MLSVDEAKLRALRHHAVTRQDDAVNILRIHPLLNDRSLKNLPSSAEMGAISRNVCRAPHPGRRDLQSSFLYYYSQAEVGSYAPLIPSAGIPPLSTSCLPGGAAILEHLTALLSSQPSTVCGGSFLPWISGTLDLCSQYRQPTRTLPVVRTLVFGRSSDAEIASFAREFNSKIAASETLVRGFIPNAFYSFDVESVTALPNSAFKISDGTLNGMELHEAKLPARIHFGFHDSRFEIVIPWEDRHLSSNLQASYTLHLPSGRQNSMWHGLFARLKGTAVGIGLKEDLKQLSDFLAHFFPAGQFGPVLLKTADLEVLLAMAGFNSARTNISALNYFFTGGVILKPWQIRCGLGRWGSTDPLPPALSLYLQSEVVGVLNTALLCLCCILVHWFVTPGIAAVVSRKTPQKFIAWFSRFWATVLRGASIPATNQFGNSVDRVGSPREMVRSVVFSGGQPLIFTPEALASCIPPWRNVTGGGCPSDQLAIDHLLSTVWPMVKGAGVPLHLRWESNLKMVTGFLSGKPTPSARTWSSIDPGCQPDQATVDLPVLVPRSSGNGFLAPLRPHLAAYKSSLQEGHVLKALSISQLALSYAWQHPEETFGLFQHQISGQKKHFSNQEFDLLRPLVAASFPEVEESFAPTSYQCFRLARTCRNEGIRISQLKDRFLATSDPKSRRQLRKKMLKAVDNRFHARTRMEDISGPRDSFSSSNMEVVESLPSVTAEVEALAITSPASPEVEPEDHSFEEESLQIDTPAWDDL